MASTHQRYHKSATISTALLLSYLPRQQIVSTNTMHLHSMHALLAQCDIPFVLAMR